MLLAGGSVSPSHTTSRAASAQGPYQEAGVGHAAGGHAALVISCAGKACWQGSQGCGEGTARTESTLSAPACLLSRSRLQHTHTHTHTHTQRCALAEEVPALHALDLCSSLGELQIRSPAAAPQSTPSPAAAAAGCRLTGVRGPPGSGLHTRSPLHQACWPAYTACQPNCLPHLWAACCP